MIEVYCLCITLIYITAIIGAVKIFQAFLDLLAIAIKEKEKRG